MQLTNYGFLETRGNYQAARESYNRPLERLSTGRRINHSYDDAGALGLAARQRWEQHADVASRRNLQSARSFLLTQQSGLEEVHRIYERMSELATQCTDPTSNAKDRSDRDLEFQSLQMQLEQILDKKFNGRRLYNQNITCGGSKNIPLGQLDLIGGKPAGVKHAARAQTVDVNAPGGTLTFRINSGGAADTYRVYMGGVEVFSLGGPFQGSDPTQQYNDPAFGFNQDGWRTSGSAADGDPDVVKVTFAPGQQTEYQITLGGSNVGLFPGQDQLLPNGGVVRTSDLPSGFTNTNLTLQLETRTIGLIHDDVVFEPMSFDTPVPIDAHGNQMEFEAKGFGTLSGHSIATLDEAKDTLNHLVGKAGYYGELNCIVYDRLPAIASELRRIDSEIENFGNEYRLGESALGRLEDADMAWEAVQHTRTSMKMHMAADVMSRVTRSSEVLMPIVTQRY